MPRILFKTESRKDYGYNDGDGNATMDQLKVGSLMRIADSLEKMERPYAQLIRDYDLYKQLFKDSDARNGKLTRSISALKGVITKLRKQP